MEYNIIEQFAKQVPVVNHIESLEKKSMKAQKTRLPRSV